MWLKTVLGSLTKRLTDIIPCLSRRLLYLSTSPLQHLIDDLSTDLLQSNNSILALAADQMRLAIAGQPPLALLDKTLDSGNVIPPFFGASLMH